MSEVNHSPTPWATETGVHGIICDYNGMIIVDTAGCSYNDLENVNASYIVSCVNSHDALTAENARLKAENDMMREVLDKASDTMRLVIESAEDVMQPHLVQEICHCGLAIENALAAEGGAE